MQVYRAIALLFTQWGTPGSIYSPSLIEHPYHHCKWISLYVLGTLIAKECVEHTLRLKVWLCWWYFLFIFWCCNGCLHCRPQGSVDRKDIGNNAHPMNIADKRLGFAYGYSTLPPSFTLSCFLFLYAIPDLIYGATAIRPTRLTPEPVSTLHVRAVSAVVVCHVALSRVSVRQTTDVFVWFWTT